MEWGCQLCLCFPPPWDRRSSPPASGGDHACRAAVAEPCRAPPGAARHAENAHAHSRAATCVQGQPAAVPLPTPAARLCTCAMPASPVVGTRSKASGHQPTPSFSTLPPFHLPRCLPRVQRSQAIHFIMASAGASSSESSSTPPPSLTARAGPSRPLKKPAAAVLLGAGCAVAGPEAANPLAGAIVACISTGGRTKRPIFEMAKELGTRMVVIDTPDRRAASRWPCVRSRVRAARRVAT